jgi:hemolysin activation/secretion protein
LPWKNVLEFFGGYSTVHADMPLPFSKSHGFSLQASTRYTIPFKVFVKEIAQELKFGFDFKRMNNTLEFVEDFPVVGQYVNLSQLALSYKIALNYGFSRTTIELDGFWSPGQIFADQSKERYNSLRYGATPKYVYGRGQIKEQLFFQKTGEFTMRAAGQLSSATLIPSEEFGLGGLETVRGYEERTINGDNALLLSLEVKTPAIRGIFTPHKARNGMVIEDKWQVVLFSDYGTALTKSTNVNYTSSNSTVVEPKRLYIAGAGPGLRYQIADYLYARADLGFKLKKDPALYGGGWAMVHFMVIANF